MTCQKCGNEVGASFDPQEGSVTVTCVPCNVVCILQPGTAEFLNWPGGPKIGDDGTDAAA